MISSTFGNTSDRMLIAVLVALVIHAAVIFGVRFNLPESPLKMSRRLDIELVQKATEKRPDKADYLAPVDSKGGGPKQQEARPEPRLRGAMVPPLPARPQVVRKKLSQRPKQKRWMTQKRADARVNATQKEDEKPLPRLDTRLLARQIADLGVKPKRRLRFSQERVTPIHEISAHKYVAAAYERAWQEKVERIGNLNYPDEARRKGLSGRLLISVYVAKDGTVRKIKLHRSSGYKVLDDAALRIVRLASPFAAFPKELASQTDVLVITRTWTFYNESGLAMGR